MQVLCQTWGSALYHTDRKQWEVEKRFLQTSSSGEKLLSLENLIISPAPPTADTFAHRLLKTDTKAKHARSITLLQCYEKSMASFQSSPAAHSSITASAWITNVKKQTLSTRVQSGQDRFTGLFKENNQYIKVFSFSCTWGQETSKGQHTLEALSILDRVVKTWVSQFEIHHLSNMSGHLI